MNPGRSGGLSGRTSAAARPGFLGPAPFRMARGSTRRAAMSGPANENADAFVVVADKDGVFPEDFYATTNFPTDVRIGGAWLSVARPEMDVGIRIVSTPNGNVAESCPMHRVRKGDAIVVGESGVRVVLPKRSQVE